MPVLDRERLEFVLLQLSGVRSEVRDLETRLMLLQQALTPLLPPVSSDDSVFDEPDAATLIHSSLGCWLRDRLSPLLAEVSALVERSFLLVREPGPGKGEPLGADPPLV